MSTSEFPAQPSVAGRELPSINSLAAVRRIPADVWIVGGLTVLAAALRFVAIGTQSFWTDEALTAYEAHLPFGAMINTVVHVETTPPLYFVLVWFWAKIFGTGETALRSLSALAGVAVIPLVYLSARELISRWAGVIAAALAAVNPFLVWYSQEARAYMLLATLSAASFLWFVRATRDPSTRNLLWWVACSALALTTHFFAGFLIAPEALWLLWIARTRTVGIAVGAVAAAQLAMLPFALIDTGHGAGWIHAIPRFNRIGQVPLQFALASIYRRATNDEGLIGAAIVAAVVIVLLVLRGGLRERRGAALAAAIAATVLFVPLALGYVGPDYFLARNLIPGWIPLVIVLAAACAVPRARVAGAAFAALLVAAFAFATFHIQANGYLQRPQWRDVARALGPASVPRAILASGGESANPLRIYLPHTAWVQPHTRMTVIREVDVVGARALVTLTSEGPLSAGSRALTRAHKPPSMSVLGVALPRFGAPPGTVVAGRARVDGWVVARFRLLAPWRVDIDQLKAAAPRFFHGGAPQWVLAFVQRPGR